MAAVRIGLSGEQSACPAKFTKNGHAPRDISDFKRGPSRLKRLLVNAVAVVDLRARQLGDRQHSLIVLEDPAELADLDAEFPDAIAAGVFDQHEGEHARHSAVVELLGDAHQWNAGTAHARLAQ